MRYDKKIKYCDFDFNHDCDTHRHALVINAFSVNFKCISKRKQIRALLKSCNISRTDVMQKSLKVQQNVSRTDIWQKNIKYCVHRFIFFPCIGHPALCGSASGVELDLLHRLQCVYSMCMRCRSTLLAFAPDPRPFTTHTTLTHHFDFNS